MTVPRLSTWLVVPDPVRRPARAVARPTDRRTVLGAVALLVLAAWTALVVQAWRIDGGDPFLAALCQPALATAAPGWAAYVGDVLLGTLLWSVMSVAMMLPSALPMLVSHADARTRLADRTASSAWVAVGYIGIWLGVSVVAGAVQAAAPRIASGWTLPPGLGAVLAGGLVGAAGLYQFSALKQRCLAFCRHDVGVGEISRSVAGTFRLGLRQGLNCLGCCGPVMVLMLLAGFANLFWMVGFALLMTIEKGAQGPWPTRLIGAGLMAAGLAIAAAPAGIASVAAAFGRLIAGGIP